MASSRLLIAALAVVTAAAVGACGGGSSSPTSPSPGGGTPSPSPGSGNVITITSSGVSPKQLTVSPGTRVQFVNNDTTNPSHQMASDPHPDHTDCIEINQVGFITPGQTKETGNLNTVRACGYHDHNQPSDDRWRGQITIR
jgi:plastocyanin